MSKKKMNLLQIWLVLLLVAAGGAALALKDAYPNVDASTDPNHSLETLANHGGWVNPEDLLPMPQCIGQQDQRPLMRAMTKCTSKICINHFGVFCTRHQWLTQLSCLNIELTPVLLRGYLPRCYRSILAKAQLYSWVRNLTGRTWLAVLGDSTDVQILSPASLTEGFASFDTISKAPMCMAKAVSTRSREPFPHAIGSCAFTGTSQHHGNAVRPWEYNEGLHSMRALDQMTPGYDLTGKNIPDGNYFDKACFCEGFAIGQEDDPCSKQSDLVSHLAPTQQRLWMNATCGSKSLPTNWTVGLKTTRFDYIPFENWGLPGCLADSPQKEEVRTLTDRCTREACEVDSNGYCNIKRTVDRSCFCSVNSYNQWGTGCHVFEKRIEYVQWMHNLCGNVDDWHGLVSHWPRLAAPIAPDMLPWRWLSNQEVWTERRSTLLRLASLALPNAAPFLALYLSAIPQKFQPTQNFSVRFLKAMSIAAIAFLFTFFSALLIHGTPYTGLTRTSEWRAEYQARRTLWEIDTHYESVPIFRFAIICSSVPRLTWLAILLALAKFETVDTAAISGMLVVEWNFQALGSYAMGTTVAYGMKHNFYGKLMKRLDAEVAGKVMYAGALVWTIIAVISLVVLLQAFFKPSRTAISTDFDTVIPKHSKRKAKAAKGNLADKLRNSFYEQWTHIERLTLFFNKHWDAFEHHIYTFLSQRRHTAEKTKLINQLSGAYHTDYGTLANPTSLQAPPRKFDTPVRFYAVSIVSLLLLWAAQWCFWGGLLALGSRVRFFIL